MIAGSCLRILATIFSSAQLRCHRSHLLTVCFCCQVDGALLSHPDVAEAVSFGAPDEKYGEIVAAAIVPSKPVGDKEAFIQSVRQHAGSKLAKFKVTVKTSADFSQVQGSETEQAWGSRFLTGPRQ